MNYKGYTARITLDEEHGILHGEVLGLTDVVTFHGKSVEEAITAFYESVDDYLAFCDERGEVPEKPYSGRFLIRMEPELHRDCAIAARKADKSLNAWIVFALKVVVAKEFVSSNLEATKGEADLERARLSGPRELRASELD